MKHSRRQVMNTPLFGLILLVLAGAVVAGEAVSKRYESFEVRSQDGTSPTFIFSAADATSESPIVISVPGRKLTEADRQHRVGLQKYWLSKNVPKDFEYRVRSLVECGLQRPGEFAACDHYVFVDPKSEQEFHYYIYVGNWP
ncbi:MAG TPA: hypothetical protein VGD45_16870 [Steroidobacter sp.]|uniref:hypothetical protein n=1 Tax=Steroidobacter sp. TaxID=1978227 RepID=UPI002EDAE790